jgi:hypothetical protein
MSFLMGKGLQSSKIISQIVTGLRLPRTSQMRRCVERGVARNYGQAVSVLSYLSANVSALNGADTNVAALRTHLISEYGAVAVATDKKSLLEPATGGGVSSTTL